MRQGTTALIPGINQHSLESHIASTSSLPTGSRKTIKDCGYDQKCPEVPATTSDKTVTVRTAKEQLSSSGFHNTSQHTVLSEW